MTTQAELIWQCAAALSDDGTTVVLDGWTHVKPLFWPPLLPAAHIRIISFVHLSKQDGAPSTHSCLLVLVLASQSASCGIEAMLAASAVLAA